MTACVEAHPARAQPVLGLVETIKSSEQSHTLSGMPEQQQRFAVSTAVSRLG